MAWDKTLPSNSTKIRNYPSVLTANFAALETGDSSLLYEKLNVINRNAGPLSPVTPVSLSTSMQVFSANSGGNAELFVRDTASNSVQLTYGGLVGGQTQDFVIQNFQFEDNATTYNQGNIVKARGSFNSSGTLTNGSNMSTSGTPRPATGQYNVDVNADVLENGSSYQVFACVTSVSGNGFVYVSSKGTPATSTAVTITLRIQTHAGVAKNASFDVIVVGGV